MNVVRKAIDKPIEDLQCALADSPRCAPCIRWSKGVNTHEHIETIMTNEEMAEQDRELTNAQTARLFHLHAIEQHEKALEYHREAVRFHGLNDLTNAMKNALLAQTHTLHATEHTAAATKRYSE